MREEDRPGIRLAVVRMYKQFRCHHRGRTESHRSLQDPATQIALELHISANGVSAASFARWADGVFGVLR